MNPIAIGLGVHKCGTSWLYHMLDVHPEIHLLQRDTHFFSKESEFEKGIDFYRKQLVFTDSGQSLALEMSNDYLSSRVAIERIKEHFPSAKLICCLRNPIDRAFSHYKQDFKTGATREQIFEAALRKNPRFIERGYYAEDLRYLLTLFPKEQIKVLFFDDIIKAPSTLLADLWSFLEIEQMNFNGDFVAQKINAARVPKSILIEQWQNHAYHKLQRSALGRRVWEWARSLGLGKAVHFFNRGGEEPMQMSDALRQELQNTFQEDIATVFDLLERDDLVWA